jgi:hypothetical protein
MFAHEKDLQILTRQGEIPNTSPPIINTTGVSSNLSLLQISQHQKIKMDVYRMPKNSNLEKKLYDHLHETFQLDFVNFRPEILSAPVKLADIVNKRWREIFQKGHCMPLPDNTI